jgi:hypothetical protein
MLVPRRTVNLPSWAKDPVLGWALPEATLGPLEDQTSTSFHTLHYLTYILYKPPILTVHILSVNAVQVAMPVLTTIRQSPAYLYVKTYCLCAAITLFQVAPASPRIFQLEDRFHHTKQRAIDTRFETSNLSKYRGKPPPQQQIGKDDNLFESSEKRNSQLKRSRPGTIINRWVRKAVDLAQVKKQLRTDNKDLVTYPELNWDSAVRRLSSLHPEEQRFIELRRHRISSQGANSLHKFLDLSEDEHVDPRDLPLIGLGGSGGGYRAMYGFAAFMSESDKLGLWDCLTWTAGVSGSCWTLAAYYTIAKHDFTRITRHYPLMARDLAHPLSIRGLNTVVRSKR